MFKVLAASTLVLVTVLSVAAEESRYRLRSGDTIELNFVYVPEFNQTLTIQPDGYITLRGIGDVRADGRSMPELKKEIESRYSEIARAWQRSKAFGKGGRIIAANSYRVRRGRNPRMIRWRCIIRC